MAFNGSGTYTLPAGNPVVTGTTISSSTTNTTNSDIATALTNCITRDGQSTPSANLPMNAKKLTGLAVGTSAGDSVRYEQTARINESTGANSNITSLTGLTTALSAAQGGTGLAGGGSTAGLVLTADGAGGFALSSSSPSVVRSAKTSAYTIVAGDKGTLIEVTSGTFTLSLTAAATLGSGWWCYVSNIGSGQITLDPNSSETITVNGTSRSTWVQWTTEIGILQCNGTGFNYYQVQKGYIQQVVSSAVASITFSAGIAARKLLKLTYDNISLSAYAEGRFYVNGAGDGTGGTGYDPNTMKGYYANSSALSGILVNSDPLTLGGYQKASGTGAERASGKMDISITSSGITADIDCNYTNSAGSVQTSGHVSMFWDVGSYTTLTDFTFFFRNVNISTGTVTLWDV